MWNRWNRKGSYNNNWKSYKRSWGNSTWTAPETHSQAERDSWMQPTQSTSSQAEPEDDGNQVFMGTIRGPVVGLQYYNGENLDSFMSYLYDLGQLKLLWVSNKEMVSLVREPRNPYDSNAVKVENIWGQQVGHIKRDLAAPLAYIMDNKLARLEGMVPSGKNNAYRLPVEISLWGAPDKAKTVSDKLRRHGYMLKSALLEQMSEGGSNAEPPAYVPQVGRSKSVVLSQAEMHNKLDCLFENLKEEAKNIELEPAAAIHTKLYSHQKQALHWMCVRENNNDLPHFWKEVNGKYLNTITNFMSQTKPPSVHGGILADDMGLGKTLEVISLIMTNFHGGKPLAEPGEELARDVIESEEDEFDTEEEEMDDDKDDGKTCGAAAFMSKVDPDYQPDDGAKAQPKNRQVVDLTEASQSSNEEAVVFTNSQIPVSNVVDLTAESMSSQSQASNGETASQLQPVSNVIDLTAETKDEEVAVAKPKPKEKKEKKKKEPEPTTHASGRPRRAAKKPVRYDYSDDSETEELLMEAEVIPKKKAKSAKQSIVMETVPVETKKKGKGKSAAGKSRGKGKKAAKVEEIAMPALPSLEMPEDKPAPVKAKKSKAAKTAAAQPPRPSVTVVPGVTPMNATGPRPTLIVCPLSVLGNWLGQFEEHVSPYVKLNIYNYYGHSRTKDASLLSSQDVVLTTYNTLASEYKASKEKSPLHKVNWLRIVLDEAHTIRNPAALQTKAVLALNSQRKWALTGTPIQNSIKDLWALMAFIKLEPFATDKQWWLRTIARPISHNDKTAVDRLASLMNAIALRRTKTQKVKGRLLVDLPEKKIILTKVELKGEERQLYDTMAKEGKVTIGKYFKAGTLLANYGDVLAILLRLRQLCCHPSLIAAAAAAAMAAKDADGGGDGCNEELKKKLIATLLAVLSQGADEECCVCLESLNTPVITPCAHVFCDRCINDVIRTEGEGRTKCPLCRGPVIREQLVHVPAEAQEANKGQVTDGEWHSSTKVDALMEQLIKIRKEDPSIKCLVVSQFTSLLNLLEKPLKDSGFQFARLDGSMTAQKREAAINAISSSNPKSPTIMLLSLKAGGLGINLTRASRVFLMDPAWNPAAEEQCFDRCHRLGQTREVIVTKFIIENSVEERMLELQEKKRNLMKGAFGKKSTAEERRQARTNDIKVLMDITASQIM